MIPKSVVFDRIVQLNMKSGSLKKDYSDIQYMDNDGKMHPTMDDVRLVNAEIHKRNNPETKNNLIRNLYMDKNGNSHPTMDDVRSANDKILKKKYPERIKDTDLITKIQKPYFN